jgi:hypothetical protein
MPAPRRNQFWKHRSTHGPKKIFESPEQLWNAACEYFEWCDRNPLKEQKAFSNGKRVTVPLMRPFTHRGLCIFLDISRQTWDNYRNSANEGLLDIIEKISDIIYVQKFDGAVTGLMKENIIARELGLGEKTTLNFDEMTDEQIDRLFEKHISNARIK